MCSLTSQQSTNDDYSNDNDHVNIAAFVVLFATSTVMSIILIPVIVFMVERLCSRLCLCIRGHEYETKISDYEIPDVQNKVDSVQMQETHPTAPQIMIPLYIVP